MRHLWILFFYLTATSALDLQCVEVHKTATFCTAINVTTTHSTDELSSLNGNAGEGVSFVELIINNQNTKFVPGNIAKYFPGLQILKIIYSNLEIIRHKDLKELVRLDSINLKGNKLKVLESDLFQFNNELTTIDVSGNNLQYIGQEIFVKIPNLQSLEMSTNPCTSSLLDNGYLRSPVYYEDIIKSTIRENCYSESALKGMLMVIMNELINDLSAQNEKLQRRFNSCDGNFNSAVKNLHNNLKALEFVNRNDNIVFQCVIDADNNCNAVDLNIPFTNMSLATRDLKHDNITTTLTIFEQQTLFLPINLVEIYPNLSELSVIESGLYEIQHKTFKGMWSLINLNLTTNKIQEIPYDTFKDLKGLQKLDLSLNGITSLDDKTFINNQNLEELRLNNNNLKSIRTDVFEMLSHLKFLFLQKNKLKFISATLLTPLKKLLLIDLSENACINMRYPEAELEQIEAGAIDNCIEPIEFNCKVEIGEDDGCRVNGLIIEYPKTKISKVNGMDANTTSISVDNQFIKFLPHLLSKNFPHLKKIEVKQSNLISLHRTNFDGFDELTHVVITQNNLSFIDGGTFNSIPRLEFLDLSSNGIVTLPNNVFSMLTNMHTLILTDNQIANLMVNILPRRNVIEKFQVNKNKLEVIETKIIRYLRKAKIIDLTENICIDMKFEKSGNSSRALIELSGEIDLNCSSEG